MKLLFKRSNRRIKNQNSKSARFSYVEVGRIIQEWCNEAGVGCSAQYAPSKMKVEIYSLNIGYFIGREGILAQKYKDLLQAKGYSVETHMLHEEFIPRRDYDDVIAERIKSYYEWEFGEEDTSEFDEVINDRRKGE